MSAGNSPGALGNGEAEDLDSVLRLLSGRHIQLRIDALGQLGRRDATGIGDAQLADLIEDAGVAGVFANTHWDPRVLIQLRAMRIFLHRPYLPILQEICNELLDPGYVRKRMLAEFRAEGVFEGIRAETHALVEAWPEGMDWRSVAAELGAVFDIRFADRRAGTVRRAQTTATIRRAPTVAAPASARAPAHTVPIADPSQWSSLDVRTVKVRTRLSPIVAELCEQLRVRSEGLGHVFGARRLLIHLGDIDGWLKPTAGFARPGMSEPIRAVAGLFSPAMPRAWPLHLRKWTDVKFAPVSTTAPITHGLASAAMAIALWRRQLVDQSVIRLLVTMGRSAPARSPAVAVSTEKDRSRPRAEVKVPIWLIEAVDRTIASRHLPWASRAEAVAQSLSEADKSRTAIDSAFGAGATAALARALNYLHGPQPDRFLAGSVEKGLVMAAHQHYGDALRDALERMILLEAAAARLFTLVAPHVTAVAIAASERRVEEQAIARLRSLSGPRTAELFRQAVAAAGPLAKLRINDGAVHLAIGA